MTRKTVLLLGLGGIDVDAARAYLARPDLDLFGGGSIEELRALFAERRVDHLILGGGIDLEVRLAIVRESFLLSRGTSVHMKDRASGPDGYFPFVRAVLDGLRAYGGGGGGSA